MPILRPDKYEHNNPFYPIADSDFVKGGLRSAVADLSSLYALSANTEQLKQNSTIVYVTSEDEYYILIDSGNTDNSSGWTQFSPTVTIDNISGLTITTPSTDDIITYDGSGWVNQTPVDVFDSVSDGDYLVRSGDSIIGVSGNYNSINSYTASTVTLTTLTNIALIQTSGSSITVNLPATPSSGQTITIKDKGSALTNNITVSGNGNDIDGASNAIINTNYGAIEVIYDGSEWFITSFVN